jgi:hypothetical protein
MVSSAEEIYCIGFPAAEIADLKQAYWTDTSVTKGIVSKETTSLGTAVYQTDAAINPGNSVGAAGKFGHVPRHKFLCHVGGGGGSTAPCRSITSPKP